MMGIGRGSGKNRAEESALSAISSALLDVPITGAKGIVFNVLGGSDMSLQEVIFLLAMSRCLLRALARESSKRELDITRGGFPTVV